MSRPSAGGGDHTIGEMHVKWNSETYDPTTGAVFERASAENAGELRAESLAERGGFEPPVPRGHT
jgi:hypothetical protein